MNAAFNVLAAIAADPNVAPAFRAAVAPVRMDNWVVLNGAGRRVSVVWAPSAQEAVARYWEGLPESQRPADWTARLLDWSDSVDVATQKAAGDAWGRLD